MAVQPSAEVVAADLLALMVPGRGALDDDLLRACRAVAALAIPNGQVFDDDLGRTRKLLLDFASTRGDDAANDSLGKKGMSPANQIAVVARAIRLYDGLPTAIVARRAAAVEGTKVSVGIFKTGRRGPNTIRRFAQTFAEELVQYAADGATQRARTAGMPDSRPAVTATAGNDVDPRRVETWERLRAMSARLAAEIDSVAEVDAVASRKLSEGAYVERDVEAAILGRLIGPDRCEPEIIVGDAGDGKTTLLWSLHRKLSEHRAAILLSALWFQPDEQGRELLSLDDVVAAIPDSDEVVVLLDTADLLLHSASNVQATITLIERLTDLGVPMVISTRPREALTLPMDLGRRTDLGAYSERELTSAVPTLVESYCPADVDLPTDPTASLKQARSRGLVVERVCSSPLLLRLLFELASPSFPRLEIDVTGLYRQYWERRVVADLRTQTRVAARRRAADLSTAAGLIGIAMVAAGRPELKIESAVRRCSEIASKAGLAVRVEDIRDAVDALVQRGVLTESAGSIRFLHQTLFEFAAAQGLANRGSERELPRILSRLEQSPDDLFLGAVLEQLLILLADDELAEDAVSDAVRRLTETKQPSLVEIGMLAWAHRPSLAGIDPSQLNDAHPEAIERFVRVVPSVHSAAEDVIGHLGWIWQNNEPLRPKVVDACASLARRSPKTVAEFVATVDMLGELADKQRKMVRANATPLLLLEAVLPADLAYTRPAVLYLMDQLASDAEGKATIAGCLRVLATQWPTMGSDDFLADIENTIERIQQRSGDSDAKLVREALSEVTAAHWFLTARQLTAEQRDEAWEARLIELCRGLEDIPIRGSEAADDGDDSSLSDELGTEDTAMRGDQSPVLGARLIAVARVVAAMQPGDPHIEATLDRLFALSGPAATRQLARGCIAHLLITANPASECVIERLSACLTAHLPADYNTFEPGPELWAAVARSCLMDSRIPPEAIAATVTAANDQCPDAAALWTRRDMLLGLAPAAIAAGHPTATEVFTGIRRGDITLPDTEKNIFLDNAVDRIAQAPDKLAPMMIDLAKSVNRSATARVLAEIDAARPTLLHNQGPIDAWIDELLQGPDRRQGDGARLLLALIRNGVAHREFEELTELYPRLTHPEAKADVVRAIGAVTLKTPRNEDAIEFLRGIVRPTRHPTPKIGPMPGKRGNPVIIDAARDALLEAFGFQQQPSPLDWDTVFTLNFAPRLSGTKAVDMAGAGNLSLFLTHIADAGHVEEAASYLTEVIDTLAPIRSRQGRLGSNRLRVAIGTITRKASKERLDALLDTVDVAPVALATLLIRAAVRERYDDVRATVDALAAHPTLGREVIKSQRNLVRIVGQQTFPDVLSPV